MNNLWTDTDWFFIDNLIKSDYNNKEMVDKFIRDEFIPLEKDVLASRNTSSIFCYYYLLMVYFSNESDISKLTEIVNKLALYGFDDRVRVKYKPLFNSIKQMVEPKMSADDKMLRDFLVSCLS
jgi:hypothetical protein